MGDMKTPDFEDLLAAFDIPDATGLGAKEATQEGKGEFDNQNKPSESSLEEAFSLTISTDFPVVGALVKDSGQCESLNSGDERPHSSIVQHESIPQEMSVLAKTNASGSSKHLNSLLNRNTPLLQQKPFETLSQPLSCTGSELAKMKGNLKLPYKQEDFFTGLMESMNLVTTKNDVCEEFPIEKPIMKCVEENQCNKTFFDHEKYKAPSSLSDCGQILNSSEPFKSESITSLDSKSQSKLASCLDSLVALNALNEHSNLTAVECKKVSPPATFSPGSPYSPLDTMKRLMKPSDSPMSFCSDSSGMVSPAVASSPAIPRVRIKTIKTSSGRIRRTVVRVSPDSETEELNSANESSPCQSMISEDSFNMSPSQNGTFTPKVLPNKSESTIRVPQSLHGPSNKRQLTMSKKPKPKKSLESRSIANTGLPKAMHLASLNLVPHSLAASVASRSCNQTSVQTVASSVSSSVSSSVPLVHQVYTTCPSPLNKAVGTLNRLLHYANPVPTYVPNLGPPPECNITLPPRGYRCLECGDSFVVERSLKFHFNRRSVHIEVTCTHCKKALLFFNRCALLAHAREHKVSGSVMQCTQLYMKPIAEEELLAPLRAAESPSVQSSVFKAVQKNPPVMPLRPEHRASLQRLCCVECDQHCSNLKALAGHYQRVSEDTEKLLCKECSMILPNNCSFRAHERVHGHTPPFCCPECGLLCGSADIQSHVEENCLHYARKAWYKCLHCDVVFKSPQGQKAHIQEKHRERFYKCAVCPVAFKTSDRCEMHLKTKHGASNSSPQLIFKCSCETIFKKKALLYQHFQEDACKRVKCVFKCPKCKSIFTLKQQLMQHFKKIHKGTEQKNGHPIHKQQQEKRTVRSEKEDLQRKSNLSKDGTKAKRMKRYPCQLCDQSFNFSTSLRKHIRKDHEEKQKQYFCWHCTETTTFMSSVRLENHMSLMHGIRNADQETNRFLRKDLDVKAGDVPGDGDAPGEKRLKTSIRCAKCGFVTTDDQEFERHIPQHKLEQSTPQCGLCGLCFTSALALNRHRHIVHKVRAPQASQH